jgi:hypothetical protein
MSDESVQVFLVVHKQPIADATMAVVCSECGGRRYTSPKNLHVALIRKWVIMCLECVDASPDSEKRLAGIVRDGREVDPKGGISIEVAAEIVSQRKERKPQ